MQRVGRINRVGTKFNDIYVFNFFPSSQVSENMTLEENISSKIQAFHDTLGEDFKYLSENEDVDTYGIFGKTLYDKLNSDKVLEEEDFEEDTSLKYLNIINRPSMIKFIIIGGLNYGKRKKKSTQGTND